MLCQDCSRGMIYCGNCDEEAYERFWSADTISPKRYRHYKGGLYTTIAEEAKHTETGEWFVVYANEIGDVFIRPHEMFHGYTEDGRKRFDLLPEAE